MSLQSTARLHPAADPCRPASMSQKGQMRPPSGVYLSFTLRLLVNVFKRRFLSSCSQRSPHEVDMNELMAAMVLSSLSCSPLLHSPAQPDLTGTQQQTNKQHSFPPRSEAGGVSPSDGFCCFCCFSSFDGMWRRRALRQRLLERRPHSPKPGPFPANQRVRRQPGHAS